MSGRRSGGVPCVCHERAGSGGRPRRGHPCLRPAYSEFNSGDLAKHKPGRPFASDSMKNGGSEGAGSLAQTPRLHSLCLAECERHAPAAQRSGWINSRGRWQLQQCRASSIDYLTNHQSPILKFYQQFIEAGGGNRCDLGTDAFGEAERRLGEALAARISLVLLLLGHSQGPALRPSIKGGNARRAGLAVVAACDARAPD